MADETGRRIIVNNEGRRVKAATSPSFFCKNMPDFLSAFHIKAFSDSVFQ